jgi:hypothetical protein
MSGKYGEPWVATNQSGEGDAFEDWGISCGDDDNDDGGGLLFEFVWEPSERWAVDRAVACVNVMAGYNPEKLHRLLELCGQAAPHSKIWSALQDLKEVE